MGRATFVYGSTDPGDRVRKTCPACGVPVANGDGKLVQIGVGGGRPATVAAVAHKRHPKAAADALHDMLHGEWPHYGVTVAEDYSDEVVGSTEEQGADRG